MRDVLTAYETAHPHVEMTMATDKPMAMLAQAGESQEGPAAVVTMGDVEMRWLASAGAVTASDVRTIAVNTYPLVVVAAADGAVGVEDLADLAGDGVVKILLEDSAQSSLGDRAERGLKQLGLWEEVAPKVVRPKPDDMLLANVVDGEADAAVLFRDCLSGDGDATGSVPKTLRVIAEIPADTYSPIPYQAAALRSASGTEVADAFVEFLVSREGKTALAAAGMVPASGLKPAD
jgi:molybdate transport system substrate-binding protein